MAAEPTAFPTAVFLRWIVEHDAVGSNTELAVLVNVSSQWRDRLITELTRSMAGRSRRKKRLVRPPLLLVPSWISFLLHETDPNNDGSVRASASTATAARHHTFCLSWFHPDGMQMKAVAIDDEYSSPESFDIPSTQALMEYSDRAAIMDSTYACCLYQWNSYTEASDVLKPFGYTAAFVDDVISRCRQKQQEAAAKRQPQPSNEPSMARTEHSNTRQRRTFANSTSVVRGSTVARPEGFCFCWDNGPSPSDTKSFNRNSLTAGSRQAATSTSSNENLVDRDIQERWIMRRREVERELLPRVVLSWPSSRGYPASDILQQPHRTPSSLHHHQQQQHRLPSYTVNSRPEDHSREAVSDAQGVPCVQFLDVTRKHAVRLFTLPFDCGPVELPITIFCVGIATEDGCFFSSLNHCFEFGHMYPSNQLDASTERSAVCMCTENTGYYDYSGSNDSAKMDDDDDGDGDDYTNDGDSQRVDAGSGYENNESSQKRILQHYQAQDCASSASDDSSMDKCLDDDIGLSCTCEFKRVKGWDDDDDSTSEDEDDIDNKDIRRGYRGPGSWHCYTLVYDGERSRIRIDGVEEQMQLPDRSDCRMGSAVDASSSSNYVETTPTLDGFTIGSDHTFNMSLCFGQGSDGEGEGAISELVAFKGRMEDRDIDAMERYLMKKHHLLLSLRRQSFEQLMKEDQWMRRGYFALLNPPQQQRQSTNSASSNPPAAAAAAASSIPLRYLTRNQLVAWSQCNPVTGQKTRIQRIGCRNYNDSSSDW